VATLKLVDGLPLFVNLLEGKSSAVLREHALDLILLMADNGTYDTIPLQPIYPHHPACRCSQGTIRFL